MAVKILEKDPEHGAVYTPHFDENGRLTHYTLMAEGVD